MPTDQDYARLAVERGLLGRDEALRCLEQARTQRRSFLELAVTTGAMGREQAEELAKSGVAFRRLEEPVALSSVSTQELAKTLVLGPSGSDASAKLSRRAGQKLPSRGDEFGGYLVERELGRGAMGAVFLARRGESRFAIKIITSAHRTAMARFGREAEALAAVDRHPNIVRIHGFSQQQDLPYLVLDFVEGGSLGDLLEEDGQRLDPKRAAEICMKVARALAFVHKRGILHRDLKPDNILIRAEDGEPLLTDFGLAKGLDSEALTASNEILGTPFYMSPEQVSGDNESVGPRSDLWSLGVVLYELCTGERPFRGGSTMDLLIAISSLDPHPPRRHEPSISRDLESIILSCLEKEQEHRYFSCEALAADLERYLSGQPVESRHSSIATVIRRKVVRRFGLPALGSIALGLLMLGGLGWLAARWAEQRRWRGEATSARAALIETLGRAHRSLYEHLALHLADVKDGPSHPACGLLNRAEGELARIVALQERSEQDPLARGSVVKVLTAESLGRLRASVGLLRLIEEPRASRERGEDLPKAERALCRGLRAFAFQRYAVAHAAFEEAARSSALAPAARLGQGLAALGLGDVDEAAVVLERLPKRLVPLYRRSRIQVHAVRAVRHIMAAKNAALATTELEALRSLSGGSKDAAWEVLNKCLAETFARLGTTRALLRSWDFAVQLKKDPLATWRLPSSIKLHRALADRARKAGAVSAALHHLYKIRELDPSFAVPKGFRAEDLFRYTHQRIDIAVKGPKKVLEIAIEASRAGILAPIEVDQVLAPLYRDGSLDELVAKSAPEDPIPRFWRGLCRHTRKHNPSWSRQLREGIADLTFCLAARSLPPAFRAKALQVRVLRRIEQGPIRDPKPLLRDLEEALTLPHPEPDEVLFLIYRVSRPLCSPEQLISMLDRTYAAATDRLKRSREDRLAEGRPELAPMFPMGAGRYRSVGGGALLSKAIEQLKLGQKAEALKTASQAYKIFQGTIYCLQIYGYCLALADRQGAIEKLRLEHFKDLTEAERAQIERYWKKGPVVIREPAEMPASGQ